MARFGNHNLVNGETMPKGGGNDPGPLGTSFANKLRPLLDAVDRLRSLGVLSQEGISLPTIVVVGDQSSGKSSVLESLSGVELPKGQGIVTRVPLLLRLKSSSSSSSSSLLAPKITISYLNKELDISEEDITSHLSSTTHDLAGPGKAIAYKPITLTICRHGAPDLTLVDLPSITRVPVQGQPDDIYEKIQELILQYIKPHETIILNVLSAATDFSVCESIRMSRQVDKLGERTLAVVTKVDMCPDGLLQKITDDAVKIGLGYICVRNRTLKEATFEEAAKAERALFSSHAELKNLSKSMVGIDALASRLVQLQTLTIARVLPMVLKKIDSSLEKKREELKQLSTDICNAVGASVAFFNVSLSLKQSLQDILIVGDEYADEKAQPSYTASLHSEFAKFTSKITTECAQEKFLGLDENGKYTYLDCIERLLSESLGTNLPNVVPQAVIEKLVRQLVDSIANVCTSELPSFVHDAARKVSFAVVAKHAGRFPNLRKLYIVSFQRALNECKAKCFDRITRVLEMEKAVVYTTNCDLYNVLVSKFMQAHSDYATYQIMPAHEDVYVRSPFAGSFGGGPVSNVEGIVGRLDLAPLLGVKQSGGRQVACNVLAYWIILSRRLADEITREVRFSVNEALLNVADGVVGQVAGNLLQEGNLLQDSMQRLSMEEMMAEQPEVAHDRLRLRSSIDMLSKSKDLIDQVLGDCYYI